MICYSKDLQCKPFSWFLKNVYPEKFILDDPKHVFAYGRLKNPTSNTCLDNLQVSAFWLLLICWLVCGFGMMPILQLHTSSFNIDPFAERRQGLVRPGSVRLPQLHGQRSVLLILQEVSESMPFMITKMKKALIGGMLWLWTVTFKVATMTGNYGWSGTSCEEKTTAPRSPLPSHNGMRRLKSPPHSS